MIIIGHVTANNGVASPSKEHKVSLCGLLPNATVRDQSYHTKG